MFKILLLLMIVMPIVELWILLQVGSWIGAGYTVVLVILSGVVGAVLMKKASLQTIRLIQLQLSKGELPGHALLDGACILIGGVALLLPGFVTDFIGLLLFIPFTRSMFKAYVLKVLAKWVRDGRFLMIRR